MGVPAEHGVAAIDRTTNRIGMPTSIRGAFYGTAKTFQSSLNNEPWLLLAALVAVYIVLGVLYESYFHPLTIISTLPSAGVGALLALLATNMEFSLIAFIGILLLVGIVKKNAIMMIDFAITAQREQNLDARAAITRACLLRFRPIMMTTCAAIAGALPLALATGDGPRDAATAGHFHRRRIAGQPGAHAVHDAGRVPLYREAAELVDVPTPGTGGGHRMNRVPLPAAVLVCLGLAACAVGPDYVRPDVPAAAAYKELGDWQPAQPQDTMPRGAWWQVYRDPKLDELEQRLEDSNQNLKASVAAYAEARALVAASAAGFWPTLGLSASASRSARGANSAQNSFDVGASASWEADMWGRRTPQRRKCQGFGRGQRCRSPRGAPVAAGPRSPPTTSSCARRTACRIFWMPPSPPTSRR